ncbi:DUF3052 family protein [Corynebacterium mucifaciens]|uniref:DUF3052 domain-containing protein n=1 Tax=Corynebacterium ureicelerivorans TaxID=401472 RepID=UPI0023578B7C|nr:DUF3052 domain-containing protein [Corynebacterium ureicelerivorans]MDN8626593.1 DUF3052 domain-containing protein [Corynebacterium ureicelerivorans]
MSATGVDAYASRLGVRPGDVVQEIGWDEDADSALSEAVEDAIGAELLDEDADEPSDTILLWFREGDGDLVDDLVDVSRGLGPSGRIWLLTPGAGSPGVVPPSEIAESAQLAGLTQTKADRFGAWQGSCLTPRSR